MEHSPLSASYSRREQYEMSERTMEIQRDMLKSFPEGMTICSDYKIAVNTTKDLIANGAPVIYRAAFGYKNAVGRADVAMKNKDGLYDLYIVKPTSRYTRWLDEALYCKILMEKNMLPAGKAYVCAIDKSAHGNNILCVIDACSLPRQRTLEERLASINRMASLKMPPPSLSARCGSCAFFKECYSDSPESIFSLKSLSFAKKAELYKKGVRTVEKYLALGFNDSKAIREIKVRQSDDDVYDKKAIREFLSQLHYPLGFLDFETAEVLIPPDPVLSPMDTVITQFSYHLIEKKGGPVKHFDFIGDGISYPERDAAKKLIETIRPNHCVLMYSDYEKICIGRLCARLPEYADSLEIILNNLVDLEKPFARKYLVNRRMEGRSSLKKVLPALYPGDDSLNYKKMRIKNGRQAEIVYTRLPTMSDAERERAVRDLRNYCALDTLAMIKLLEKLYQYGEGTEIK